MCKIAPRLPISSLLAEAVCLSELRIKTLLAHVFDGAVAVLLVLLPITRLHHLGLLGSAFALLSALAGLAIGEQSILGVPKPVVLS
jgi:hypothetical protein